MLNLPNKLLQRPFDGRIDGKIVKDITIAILIKNPAN
jgi:hypothetical protein